jgi:hypothetical protein
MFDSNVGRDTEYPDIVIFLSPCKQTHGEYLELIRYGFLSNPFQFLILYHRNIYTLRGTYLPTYLLQLLLPVLLEKGKAIPVTGREGP